MKVRFSLAIATYSFAICLAALAGCQKKSDVASGPGAENEAESEAIDPHDLPLTDDQKQQLQKETAAFGDAVGVIQQLRDTIRDEVSDGLPDNPTNVHQALDKADLVVQWLPTIARDSGVAKEHWEVVNTTANDLRELFEKVHQNIDNGEDPGFPEVAPEIETRIGELETISQAPLVDES